MSVTVQPSNQRLYLGLGFRFIDEGGGVGPGEVDVAMSTLMVLKVRKNDLAKGRLLVVASRESSGFSRSFTLPEAKSSGKPIEPQAPPAPFTPPRVEVGTTGWVKVEGTHAKHWVSASLGPITLAHKLIGEATYVFLPSEITKSPGILSCLFVSKILSNGVVETIESIVPIVLFKVEPEKPPKSAAENYGDRDIKRTKDCE